MNPVTFSLPSDRGGGFPFLLFRFRTLSLVFDAGCLTASEMANRFMIFQYLLHFIGKFGIDFRQAFRQILVDRAFGNAEFLGDGADRVLCLDEIATDLNRPLPDVIMHSPSPPSSERLVHYMSRLGGYSHVTSSDKPKTADFWSQPPDLFRGLPGEEDRPGPGRSSEIVNSDTVQG